jgi:hypothetical protein
MVEFPNMLVLSLPLPKPDPKPNDVVGELDNVGEAEYVGELEYGYASRSFLADCASTWMAVSSVGRGIKGRMADFSEGCAFNSAVSNGSKDCGGKLASRTPTSTSPPSSAPGGLFSLPFSLFPVSTTFITRALLGGAFFGLSGVGLLSIASSLDPVVVAWASPCRPLSSSSSGSCLRF